MTADSLFQLYSCRAQQIIHFRPHPQIFFELYGILDLQNNTANLNHGMSYHLSDNRVSQAFTQLLSARTLTLFF